ncbi:hypothetical protein NKI48_34455, partial [Mesorhizobium sp. M0644]|uniref:hypothetical protein n=1 Tax=Mesorhizobium sp. M0644 TaxID=2956979 RepID=UPI003339A0B3
SSSAPCFSVSMSRSSPQAAPDGVSLALTSEDYVFHKNCSSNIAASPMSRFSMHPWAESIAGQIGKAVRTRNEARGEKKIADCHRNS